jgi:hypothetical protein
MCAPLSAQQDELIRSAIAHPDAATRFDSVCLYRLDGHVDMDALAEALMDVIKRHPGLRTVIRSHGNELVQHICSPGELAQVRRVYVTARSIDGIIEELLAHRYTLEDILAGCPLFRASLHEQQSTYLLSISINHAIYDAWSLIILWRDLAECYAARTEGRPARLPSLRATYAEYCAAQKQAWISNGDRAVAFYREAIGDCTGAVQWPRPSEQHMGSATDIRNVPVVVTGWHTEVVRAISRMTKASPFVVLMCASAMAISRIGAQPDLIIGADTTGRDDPALQDTIGFFLNTRIVHIRSDPADTLLDVVRKVRSQWIAAMRYDNIYYENILTEICDRELIKINMPTLSSDWLSDLTPRLPNVDISEIEINTPISSWRDISVFWFHAGSDYKAEVFHRPAAVGFSTASAVAKSILDILAASRQHC